MLPEIGELVFSFVVGYMGALEFLYVVRHLYHWGFQHNPEMRDYKSEAESLRKLQEQLKTAIAEAKEREAMGLKAMQDGVTYKDGFRIDEDRKKIEELKEKVRIQEQIAERQREIEEELERQRKIEEETKQQLKKAEEELRRIEEEKKREKQKAEEEKRKAEEAKKRAEDEKRRAEEEEIKRKQRLEEEENMKKILEAEKKKEEEQRRLEEEKENQRKLLQAEKEREEKQRQLELDAENARIEEQLENERKLIQAEMERAAKQQQLELEAENERKLLQAEKEREEKQRQIEREEEELRRREREENELKLLQAEREREEQQRLQEIEDEKVVQKLLEAERERERAETARLLEAERQQEIERQQREAEEEERVNTAKLIAAEKEAIQKQRELEENEENMRNLLKAERELELKKQEMEEEAANLQRLIEAEKEMEERQRRIDEEALEKLKTAQEEMELRQTYDPTAEAEEEAFVKKEISKADQSIPQTVKTQYGQAASEALKPKSLLFPGISEDSSSAEPASSLQSSFSTQQSSEAVQPDLHFDEYERQAPDGGEDAPSLQYSDDYLRSLDGIKNKPLVREDGSGRRRAFKKRRSSGSSTSSRESRASREEELKMFTSLEEEEFENIRKGDSEYDAIKYASEPNLKVSKQHRRHKRSPAKDVRRDPNDKGSLEQLDEEDSNPWGEVKPENYKNTDFWKREKNLSIDEEQEEFDAKQRIQSPSAATSNIPKMSSFEEATRTQNEEAITALKRQMSKDPEPIQEPADEDNDNTKSDTKNVSKLDGRLSPAGSRSSPASASASISPDALKSPQVKRENSNEMEDTLARATSPTTGLRRSPRVDEMREYEEKWKTEDRKAREAAGMQQPNIEIECASDEDEPMSPEHLMEGISDFYDFNASINPRRSRSRSRSKTPAVMRSVSLPERRTPSPLNSSHIPARSESRSPSPDPASYKFIVQRIIPNLNADQSKSEPHLPEHGLSDFYDFHTKLNQDSLHGVTVPRSQEVHRTSVDYVLEDLKNTESVAIVKTTINDLKASPTTPEYERTISAEMRDIEKLKEEVLSGNFKRSTYAGESMDFSDEFESLREEAKHFQRSRSCSRSPPIHEDVEEMKARILARQQLQVKILEDIVKSSQNSQDFSDEITKNTVDRNRRASDTALIQKPEILFQIQDLIEETTDENFNIIDCEPEEYHHFRRFSLGQELPVEQYPEEYEIEIRTLDDLKTLTGDIEVLGELETLEKEDSVPQEEVVEEAYDSGSDDERQTVVEVDDEIDEDIWEYNEKPAEESHNEQSECEEADREIDRYADRNADDWRDIEGAVGGVSDEDSFQIDQIYDEAIKNRKPSGILRDYDCILKEIQISDEDRFEPEEGLQEKDSFANGSNFKSLDPGMWSPRSRSSRGSSRDSTRSFIEYERRDNEMRYLADPTMSAINSTRLRSRYGIVPSTSLPTGFEDDSIDVDLNYKPRREYNWRKNFKLDDDLDENKNNKESSQYLDTRKFSLGGESITLFSQSPEHSPEIRGIDEEQHEELVEQEAQEEVEKPSKKKKNRRKSRKGSKGSIGGNEEEKDEAQQMSSLPEGDSTKKKHRRESKKTAEIASEAAANEETVQKLKDEETESAQAKKRSRKHRKSKGEIILPKLDIVIPTPEKKAPPPSVAALRAALSAPPPPPPPPPASVERKPKKLWEVPSTSTATDKKSPTTEVTPKKLWETPVDKKSPTTDVKPKKLWETPADKKSPSTELKAINPQPVVSLSVSPKVASVSPSKENGAVVLESKKVHLEESSKTVAFILETQSLTLTKEEITTVKSEIIQTQTNETINLDSTKTELTIPQTTPETSQTQNQTEQNPNPPESQQKVIEQKQITVQLDSDILKDGGLYPLF